MNTTEQQADPTAQETTAYKAYLSAVADHNIICARRGATDRQKMDAANAMLKAFDQYRQAAGYESSRNLADVRRIEALTKQINDIGEMVRSAYSMVLGANSLGVIERRPEGIDPFEHDACVCLIVDAQQVLKAALVKVDGE